MLKTRVLTALAILPVLLGMLFFAPPAGWSLFMLLVALVASWEWSRLCGLSAVGQGAFLAASGLVGGVLWLLNVRDSAAGFAAAAGASFVLSAMFWVLVAPPWLARLARPGPALRVAAGFLVVWPTWFAFVVLREASPWLLLATAVLVWIADISAYFAGKAFGRHKLAPAVSPGKTWEGVAGGLAGVVLYGVILALFVRIHPTPLAPVFVPAGGLPAIAAMVLLTALSVVGDLFESWMKRGAGLKDSSRLLPGHGGVLDRIDALTSTLPVAALVLSLAA